MKKTDFLLRMLHVIHSDVTGRKYRNARILSEKIYGDDDPRLRKVKNNGNGACAGLHLCRTVACYRGRMLKAGLIKSGAVYDYITRRHEVQYYLTAKGLEMLRSCPKCDGVGPHVALCELCQPITKVAAHV